MSASDKKKLRKEQYADKMTKKQKEQRSEARKLKAYTATFVILMVAIVLFLAATFAFNWYKQSGFVEKRTIAATIGDYQMNTVEMSYYYNDAINSFYSEVSGTSYADIYLESMGLDLTQPLDQQTNPETNDTWANYFIDAALATAKTDFAFYNKAMEAGFKLNEDQQAAFDSEILILESNAQLYGGIDAYLYQIYGYGADLESYTQYLERKEIAEAYYNYLYENLSYTDDEIRAYEEGKEINFTSFSYSYIYLSHKYFLEGGTENESGTVEYTEDEENAARDKMQAAADYLTDATSVDDLYAMIENVEVTGSSTLSVTNETDLIYTTIAGVSASLAEWISDEARTEGEVGTIEITAATSEEEETEEEPDVNGIYVVIYLGSNDNTRPMSNVRHILIAPEGGYTDETTGQTVYTDEEWALAYTEAEALLESWRSGEATEDSFIALVADNTDDTGSAATGGLYEDINPASEYVPEFLSWSIDPARQVGDTEIVKTDYGYHIMYYVGGSDTNYRDYMITNEMRSTDIATKQQEAEDAVVITKMDLSKLNTSLIIAG